MDCILIIVRALRVGSCLSVESKSPRNETSAPALLAKKKRNLKKVSRQQVAKLYEEEQLYKIPGRLFLNSSSDIASLCTQKGRKGANQDAMIVWEKFGLKRDAVFCGVFDGHGPYGHKVAKRVRDSLPSKLNAHWEASIIAKEKFKSEAFSLSGTDQYSPVNAPKSDNDLLTLEESLLKAFRVMDRELKMQTGIDCFCSGSTAVTLVKQGRDLVIGNIGDSRAVLGTRDSNNSLVPVQLTVDLKPNLPDEAERIKKCRGRVFSLQDEPGVARVWLPNSDSPGLAMARAFGDFCLKDFGLISIPDISYRYLTEKDEFVVLATDGVWDVLSNKAVIDTVASAPARSSAAKLVVESAVWAWRSKYPASKVDDCAVVCLFFDDLTGPVSGDCSAAAESEDNRDL